MMSRYESVVVLVSTQTKSDSHAKINREYPAMNLYQIFREFRVNLTPNLLLQAILEQRDPDEF